MEENRNSEKRILKPSVIHDDLSETKKPEHLRQSTAQEDDVQPENPDRNYHHDEFISSTSIHDEIEHADDDEWNGEDA